MTIERRRFIVKASGAMAAVAVAAIVDAPNVIAQPKVQWRLSTAWTPALGNQAAAQRLAKVVEETSAGRFRIEVFPGGQIMQPFDCFDAASKGTIEAFMGAPYYWTTKESAVEWFATIPFGMNPEGMLAWYYQGDGLKLWEETYAAFNLVPRPGTAVPPQMAGWFRKKINTIGDYKGLKMRMGPRLGGKVIARAGATTVLTPGADIYAALERGVIDAAEWGWPHDDMKLGLHRTARYYYYPGWQEPGLVLDFGFNKRAYEALPVDLQRTLDHATAAVQLASAPAAGVAHRGSVPMRCVGFGKRSVRGVDACHRLLDGLLGVLHARPRERLRMVDRILQLRPLLRVLLFRQFKRCLRCVAGRGGLV